MPKVNLTPTPTPTRTVTAGQVKYTPTATPEKMRADSVHVTKEVKPTLVQKIAIGATAIITAILLFL